MKRPGIHLSIFPAINLHNIACLSFVSEMDDDSNADPDYHPATDDKESDRESRSSSNSLEEQDLTDKISVACDSPEDLVVSESEYDPNEPADSVVYPQLSSEMLLTTQPSGENSRGKLNNKKHACFFVRSYTQT